MKWSLVSTKSGSEDEECNSIDRLRQRKVFVCGGREVKRGTFVQPFIDLWMTKDWRNFSPDNDLYTCRRV